MEACRERFTRCDVIFHTWSTLEPTTVHWSGRTAQKETASDACVAKVREVLQPMAVRVEVQPDPPPEGSLAPDGLPFNDSAHPITGNWNAMRSHGWRMALAGMANASRLRASVPGRPYDVAMRFRPDFHHIPWWDGTFDDEEWQQRLWNCVALFVRSQRRGAGGLALLQRSRPDGKGLTPSLPRPNHSLIACGPRDSDFRDGLNEVRDTY